MGILDKIKRNKNQGNGDLDDVEMDVDSNDDDGEAAGDSSGGAFGFAKGLLQKGKELSSGGDGGEGGKIASMFGKVKGFTGRNKDSGDLDLEFDDSDGSPIQGLDGLDEDQDDDDADEQEQPERRAGIAARPDGNSEASQESDEEDEAPVVPAPVAAGGMDLGSLFEDETVVNAALKDLAESLDDISALELAADLRTFLDELQ